MTSSIDAFPAVRTDPFLPTAEMERWREEKPIRRVRLKNGQDTWLVLRQEDSQAILAMSDSVTSSATAPGFPQFRDGPPAGTADNLLLRMDPPVHTQIRRRFQAFFTAKRIAGWKPEIERITDQALDDLLAKGSPADLYEDFALIVPSQVICMLLGVDYSLAPDFDRLTRTNNSSLASADDRVRSLAEINALVIEMFDDHRRNPREGVISDLIRMVDDGTLSPEVAMTNTLVLVVGGHENTANTIGFGALQMMQNPPLVQRIIDEPSKIPVLVEEMLRTQAIVGQVLGRAATKPISVGDDVIEAGEGFAVLPLAANHDPRVYPNPHEIDLDRDVSVGHLAFGAGPHFCLGQSLARTEIATVFGKLFQRIPTLRLNEDDAPEFTPDPWIYGMRRLPVRW